MQHYPHDYEDEDSTCASSSYLPDTDMCLMSSKVNSSIEKLKTRLDKKYKISTRDSVVPAGRLLSDNVQSLLKHAHFKFVYLTIQDTQDRNYLDSVFKHGNCTSQDTLALVESCGEKQRRHINKMKIFSLFQLKYVDVTQTEIVAKIVEEFISTKQVPLPSLPDSMTTTYHDDDDGEIDSFYTAEDNMSYHSTSNSRGQSPSLLGRNQTGEIWCSVTRKYKLPSRQSTPRHEAKAKLISFHKDINAEGLADVITGPLTDSCICYATSPYEDDDIGSYKFTQDVVSLWNIPKRKQAFICIGATYRNNSWNCSDYVTTKFNWDFQNLFKEEYFNYKPKYELEKILIEDKEIAVIVIDEPDCKCRHPCCADECGLGGLWDAMDVLIRKDGKNIPADSDMQESVFKWFDTDSKLLPEEQRLFDTSLADIDKLKALLDNFNPKRAYFLAANPIASCETYMESISNVSWRRVLDFDPKSSISGTLSFAEEGLRERRFLSLSDITQNPTELSDKETNWVFMKGSTTRSDTIFAATCSQLVKENEKYMKEQCKSILSSKEPPTLVVLWYSDEESDIMYMLKFLSILLSCQMYSDDQLQLVICLPSEPTDGDLFYFLRVHDLWSQVVKLPLVNLCGIFSEENVLTKSCDQNSTLPKYSHNDECQTVDISREDMAWLRVNLDVLSLSDKDAFEQSMSSNAHNYGEEFLKGAQLTWEEIHVGAYDAQRSIHEDVRKNIISKFIRRGKSAIMNVYHAPGGGGTTFALRLLWSLREEAPCAYLDTTSFPIQAIKERIKFLSEKTMLPVVLLIDGKSGNKTKSLLDQIQYEKLIILHVQRYHLPIQKSELKDMHRVFLTDVLTPTEALHLSKIFQAVCQADRKKDVKNLTDEIVQSQQHQMFEYGIITFEHEYHGLSRYVNGYLQLKHSQSIDTLQNWQKIVGFIALSYFYGHCSISAQFFKHILGFSDIVCLQDLPNAAQQLIREDPNHRWKISYYAVAKEILEQLLGGRDHTETQNRAVSPSLSRHAKLNLHCLALEFIQLVQTQNNRFKFSSTNIILDVVTSMFLMRDYKHMDSNDVFGGPRARYSRLLEDVGSYDNQVEILKALVSIFPDEHYFHAHLGRFYSYGGEFDNAETELQLAVDNLSGKLELMPRNYSLSQSLSRAHSMFGFCYVKKLETKLGSRLGNYIAKEMHKESDFQVAIFTTARLAIGNFEECRSLCKAGNRTYGYIGELKVRLQLIEFVQKNYSKDWYSFVFKQEEDIGDDMPSFIHECRPKCDTLLAECAHVTHQTDLSKLDIYYECVNLFAAYYDTPEVALDAWKGGNSTLSRRNQISIIKLKHHKANRHSPKTLAHVDHVRDGNDLLKIIELHEESIRYELLHNTRVRISTDVVEWLHAIRSDLIKKKYKLTDILRTVAGWDKLDERDSLSAYYHYIVCTVLAITVPGEKLSEMYHKQSHEARTRLMSIQRHLSESMSKTTREWLSNYEQRTEIQKIIHRSKLGEWNNETKFWKDPATICQLQVCTGTVLKSSSPFGGTIKLDTQSACRPPIQIFFVPKNFGMYGKRFSQERMRVEFYVGFSPEHGAVAYSVQALRKGKCYHCNTPVELKRHGNRRLNICPKCNNLVHHTASLAV